ncbi:MAG TPA: GNAT family protein [Solirubrobacteraceae bacterium]|jgi:RimJ/RimL family protein N-acetyltransferase|nr:GNAT family protein [Solirubrobacteraceae bacterium]
MPAIPALVEPLSDGHVSLRLAGERDIPEVLIAHQEDPRLAAALGLDRPPSGAQLGRAMEEEAARREIGAGVTLTILAPGSDDCRGQIEADSFDWEHAHANLGIWIAPDVRGQGLGRRALALAAAWLTGAGGLVRVQLMAPADNEAAIRAALGAGFTREGVLRAHARARGGRVDLTALSWIAIDSAPR